MNAALEHLLSFLTTRYIVKMIEYDSFIFRWILDGNILELFSFRFYVLVNEPTFSGNAYMYTSQIGLERDSWLAWRKSWLSSQQVTRRIFRYVSACLEFECFTLGQSPSPSSSPRFNLLIFVFVVYSSLRLGTRCVVAYVHPATNQGDSNRRNIL